MSVATMQRLPTEPLIYRGRAAGLLVLPDFEVG